MAFKFLREVDHRNLTASHYMEGQKYMIWYYITGKPYKTYGFVQIRGLTRPLTEEELRHHIDKVWESYYAEKARKKEM